RGVRAADPAGDHLDAELDPQARPRLGDAAPARVRERRPRRAPLPVAGEGRPAPAADPRRRPRPAARGAPAPGAPDAPAGRRARRRSGRARATVLPAAPAPARREAESSMAIVCGTDFSEHAERAARVAAAFARAVGEPLVLVHVVDLVALGWVDPSLTTRFTEVATERLADLATRLGNDGLEIETRALVGTPEDELATVAEERSALLLVVGVLGYRSEERWRIGSLATRLARSAPTPVLVVADAAPFEACARGERPLRVLVGADPSRSGEAAVGWLATLRRLGACDATLLHVYDPTREHARL